MPTLITVHLVAPRRVFLPPFTGEQVRALFFRILGDSEVVVRLHDVPYIRPYAVKPLYLVNGRKKIVRNGRWIINKDEGLAFEIGVFDPEIEDRILGVLVRDIGNVVRIKNSEFFVDRIEVFRKSSFEDLFPGKTTSLVGISFVTPTLFSGEIKEHIFPDPLSVFGSLLRIWNSFAEDDAKIDEETFLGWVRERVYIRYYSLKTREAKIKDAKIVGFKGKAAYVIMDPDMEEAEYLLALLRFGLISNVGLKRTYGFGVIKPKDITNNRQIKLHE